MARQRADRDARIAAGIGHPRQAAHVAVRFAHLLDAAERHVGAPPRVGVGHARGHVLFLFALEVEADLFVELAVGSAAAECRAEAEPGAVGYHRQLAAPGAPAVTGFRGSAPQWTHSAASSRSLRPTRGARWP